MAQTHKCGQCRGEYKTEVEYLAHKCEKSGFKPTEPENLGEEFKLVSEAALARGAAKKAEENK